MKLKKEALKGRLTENKKGIVKKEIQIGNLKRNC